MKHILVAVFSLLLATEVFAQPNLSKVFTPDTIGPGSVSTITLTITNKSASPVTGLSFTDTLPAAVTIADPASASTTCDLGASGTLSAPDGGSAITLSDAQIGGSSACLIMVDVTASTPGAHTNPAVTLNSSAGSSMSLPIDLTVDEDLPGFSKSFSPASVPLGDRSTLIFTIDKEFNESGDILNLDFTDILPVGMEIADPTNASTTCGTATIPPTLTAASGTSSIVFDANGTFGFPALEEGENCTVTVDVVTTAAGELDNVSGDLLADFVSAGKASATLEVTVTPVAIQKSFTDDPTPPGGTVKLEFVIDNFDRNFSATDVAFTDDLTTALAGLTFDSLVSNDCGGTVSGVGSTDIIFSGGTIAPESFCAIQVSLTVPAAVPGIYTNTTGTVSATVDGSPVVGNSASDDLLVSPAPVLTKEFLEVGSLDPDPVVDPGSADADVVIRFTVTNTSTTSMATDIAFDDELTDGSGGFPPDTTSGFLPFPVTVTSPVLPASACGGTLEFYFPATERQGLRLTGGSLAAAGTAGDSCSFDVTVTIPQGFAPGVYLNTTEEPTATVDGATRTGKPASDTLTVVGAPTLAKSFTDDPVGPGGTVTLEFELNYSADADDDATAIAFTDDLSSTTIAGLVSTSVDSNTCTGSTVDIATDPAIIDFSGGSMEPGENCLVSVSLNIPAGAAPGTYTNTTSNVGATVGGLPVTSPPAEDDLKVTGLVFTKEFLTTPVIAGETTTLRFTVDNIHPTVDATIAFFNDNLAAGLAGLSATGPATSDDCGGTLSGTTFLNYVGGSLLSPGTMCTIEVEVLVPLGAADGDYTNTTSSLSATQGGTVTVDPAIDVLTVNSNLLQLTKEFTDDPVAPGDSVTLEFTLTNLDAGAASAIAFSDDLGAALIGMIFDSVLFDDCVGTVGGIGTDMITVSGVSLAGAASCTIRVSVIVPDGAIGNIYTNTTSSVTGTIDGFAVTGDAANDDLQVIDLLLFSKSFDGPTTATGTATLTFTITNPGANTASGLGFSDDLDAVISGLVAIGLPAVPCGAGSSITGISFLTFTGGELPPAGGTCSFDVEVLVPASATAGTFPNVTSDLFQSGLEVSEPATADLTIEPPPTFAKVFMPDTIFAGTTSTLRFTIDNSTSVIAASALAFTDNLPAGTVIATPSVGSTTCNGGTLSAISGADAISFTGGSVGSGASCTIDVDVSSNSSGIYVNTTGDLTSSSGNSGTASDTLTVTASADVSVTKTDGVTTATPGGVITYTIVAANAGPSADPSVALTDTLPADLTCTYTSVAAGGATGNTAAGAADLVETLSMPAGSSVTYTVACTIDVDATGTLSNTATVVPSVEDPVPGNNSATDGDTVLAPAADISVTKTDGLTEAIPGQTTVTYTIVATNAGLSNDPSVSLNDTLPADLTCTYTSVAAGGAAGNTGAGAGDLAETLSMPAGSSVTYTVTCSIDSGATGTLSNTATVSGSLTDNDSSNNSATDDNTVLTPEAGLSITKTSGVDSVIFGENLTYTLSVTNDGPSDSSGGTITDVLPSSLSFVSSASGCTEITGVVTCSFGPLSNGSSVDLTFVALVVLNESGTITNTAKVLGNESNPNASTDGVDNTEIQAVAPPPPPPAPVLVPVPTLSGWMLLLMTFLFAGLGMRSIRREL